MVPQKDPLGILGEQPKKQQADPLGILKKKEVSGAELETGGKAGTSEVPSEKGLIPQQRAVSESTQIKIPKEPVPKVPATAKKEGQSYISNLVSSLDRGFYKNLIGNPIKGLATVVQYGTSAMTGGRVKEGPVSDALNKFGDLFNQAIDEVTPQDPEFKNSLSDQFGQALGQVGSLVLTGGLGAGGRGAAAIAPKVTAAVPKTIAGKVAAKAAPVTAAVKDLAKEIATPASISAGLTVGQSEFDRAKQAGASDDQAFEAFYKNAAVGSVLEKIPVMQFLKRFNNATSGGVANYLKTKGVAGITGGLEEATTEVLQQVYANKTAQDIYNVNQNIFEGLAESGGIGFGVGFLLNAMGAQAKILRQQGREEEAQTVENQEEEFKAKAEGKELPAPPPATPVVKEVTPQVPEAAKRKYRVEYFDPEKGEMTHSYFDTRLEGDRFWGTLTPAQKSKGVKAYFEETTEPSFGEVAPQVPPTPRIPKERAAQLREQIKIEEVGEEVAPEVPATPEKAEPIRQLGTGSNVYFETDKYRVNDFKDKTLLNVSGVGDTGTIANIEFNTPEEAVEVGKTLSRLYPNGVPEAVLLDKVVEDIKAGKYKEEVIKQEIVAPELPVAPITEEEIKTKEYAVPERGPEGLLQPTQEGIREEGGERRGVEPPVERIAAAKKSKAEATQKEIDKRLRNYAAPEGKQTEVNKLVNEVSKFNNQRRGRLGLKSSEGLAKRNQLLIEAKRLGFETRVDREGRIRVKGAKAIDKSYSNMAIDKKFVPLKERGEKLNSLFDKINGVADAYGYDFGFFMPNVIVGADGRKMDSRQIKNALKDLNEGIPSKGANAILNSLGEMAETGYVEVRVGQDVTRVSVDEYFQELEKEAKQRDLDLALAQELDTLSEKDLVKWVEEMADEQSFEKEEYEPTTEEPKAEGGEEPETAATREQAIREAERGAVPPIRRRPPAAEGGEEVEVGESKKGERKFTKRMLEDPLQEAVKKGVESTLEYTKQTNAMTLEQAREVLNTLGEDKALEAIKDQQTNGAVRTTLGQVLIKRYNELAKKAITEEDRNLYVDKTIDIAEYVTEKLATDAGQTIQAFKLWKELTPEAQVVSAVRQRKKSARRNIDRVRKDIDSIGEKFNKANENAVKEILKSEEVDKSVKKDTEDRISKAKDKAARARQKRADLINKYKSRGGTTFTSGGLTKEGIEFVGEVAVTYIEEGIAEVQVIAEKIYADIKSVTGSSPNDKTKQEVLDITEGKLTKSDIKKVKSVNSQKLKINEIAIKHFTEVEKIKKNLAQKLMDEADMSESNAEALAKRFEDSFDRVVSRKKTEILAKEKKRFDRIQKAINEQAGKKAEKKTLQDEIIKYSNLGAFNSEQMLDLLSKKFDLGQLTTEQAAKIQELAEKIQKAPEGSSKREATEDLLAYQANLNKGNWGDVAQGIWYANILSGYRTHEKNIVSTLFNSLADLGSEIIADPKGAPYIIAGYMEGVKKKGMLEAMRTFKTGRSPIHVQAVEIPDILERKRFKGGGYNPANWFKYIGRAMKAEDVLSFQGLKEARAWQLARRDAEKFGFNTWSRSGWKKVNELLLNTQERYETAKEQAESEGLKPNTKDWKRRIYELMENSRPEAMTEDAYNFAAHGTFNYNSDGTLGAITNAVAKALDIKVGGIQPGRFVVPFTRIITNVVNNALDYSPVGIVRAAKGARGFKSFDEMSLTKGAYKPLTPEQRRTVLIKAAIGISFAAITQYMVSAGLMDISGEGPEDEKKKAQLREQGWQPYSLKIGDTWYSYLLTPLVLTYGWMGNLNDAAKYGKEDEQTLLRRASLASYKFGGMIADLTWINSAATFLGAIAEPRVSDQQIGAEKALAGMARGFVPFGQSVTQLTQAYNSIFGIPAKQVNNAWEALYQDWPIARNSLNDKINALGEPSVREIDVVISREKADPVWSYLTRKQGWVSRLNQKTVLVFDENLKQDRPITDDEYFKLSKLRGKIIKKDIERVMKEGYPVLRNGSIVNVAGEDLTSKELNNILSRRIEPLATKQAKAEIFGISYSEMDKDDLTKELSQLEREYWGLED